MRPATRAVLTGLGVVVGGAAIFILTRRPPPPPMGPDPAAHASTSASASASASVSAAPAPSPSVPAYDPKVEYEKNLASAKSFSGTPCHSVAIWVVPGRRAAIIRYDCEFEVVGQDDWSHHEGVRWVGAAPGEVIDERFTFAKVAWAPKGGLWNLRGDGGAYSAVFTTRAAPYWAHKEWGYKVFKLDGDRWIEEKLIPEYPDGQMDVDRDGVPDFPVELVVLRDHEACSALADYRYAERYSLLRLTVEGLERWNGTAYVGEVATFRPWYAARLREARAAAAALTATGDAGDEADAAVPDAGVPAECQTDHVLQIALRLHTYATVLGGSPAAVKGEVDRFLAAAGDTRATEVWGKRELDGSVPVLP